MTTSKNIEEHSFSDFDAAFMYGWADAFVHFNGKNYVATQLVSAWTGDPVAWCPAHLKVGRRKYTLLTEANLEEWIKFNDPAAARDKRILKCYNARCDLFLALLDFV